MRKLYCLIGFLIVLISSVNAQDEGTITKRERIALSSNIYAGGGMSFTFGDNIGDYSRGYNVDAGYLKRLNRVLSIGGGFSYQTFAYDPKEKNRDLFWFEESYTSDNGYLANDAIYADFTGGDISLMSLGFIVKINFVPVKDDSKFSIYAFAKPFVSYATRSKVEGQAVLFGVEDYSDNGEFEIDEILYGLVNYSPLPPFELEGDDLKKKSALSGGIFIGPGIEMNPGKAFSIFLQASIGYTFPVSMVSTKEFDNLSADEALESDTTYPINKEGFPSLNIQLGFSYNF